MTTLIESIAHLEQNHRNPANDVVNALVDVRKDRPDPNSIDTESYKVTAVAMKLAKAKAYFPDCAVCQAMTTDADPILVSE